MQLLSQHHNKQSIIVKALYFYVNLLFHLDFARPKCVFWIVISWWPSLPDCALSYFLKCSKCQFILKQFQGKSSSYLEAVVRFPCDQGMMLVYRMYKNGSFWFCHSSNCICAKHTVGFTPLIRCWYVVLQTMWACCIIQTREKDWSVGTARTMQSNQALNISSYAFIAVLRAFQEPSLPARSYAFSPKEHFLHLSFSANTAFCRMLLIGTFSFVFLFGQDGFVLNTSCIFCSTRLAPFIVT